MYARIDLKRAPLDSLGGFLMAWKLELMQRSTKHNDRIKEVFEMAFHAILPIKKNEQIFFKQTDNTNVNFFFLV